VSIDKAAIIWAALDPARDIAIKALVQLCQDEEAAAKSLKLGKTNRKDIQANLAIMTSGTMPALQRYTGVLYDALGYDELSKNALQRAQNQMFIQSSLFGLIPALERIPYYRLSAGSVLPGVSLSKLWTAAHRDVWPRLTGQILDMRSKAYVSLNPIPTDRDSFFVEVLDANSGKALNHFNKKAKGTLAKVILEAGLESSSEIPKVAKLAGLEAKVSGRTVKLFVPAGF
jgi:cytoplasmic iron level regulating protein YaaA (DUF328/UPF0246 family)